MQTSDATPRLISSFALRLDPNSSGGRADELELMAFACETYGGGPWAARVIDPFSVGRYNAIWMRESPVPIAAGVCGVRSQGNL
jgi:hypothetical protein